MGVPALFSAYAFLGLVIVGSLVGAGLFLLAAALAAALIGVPDWLVLRRYARPARWAAASVVGFVLSAVVSAVAGGVAAFASMWSIMQSTSMSARAAISIMAVILCGSGALAGALGNGISGLLMLAAGPRPEAGAG